MTKQGIIWHIKKLLHIFRKDIIVLEIIPDIVCQFYVNSPKEKYRISTLDGEGDFLKKFISEIRKDDVVYDIGSCLGLFTMHAAKLGAKVIAFEPDPGFRKRLKQNIKLNHLNGKIKVVPWAVSDKKGKVVLYTDGLTGNSPSLREQAGRRKVNVSTNSIDNSLSKDQIPKPRIVKMDIEGAEFLALKGMSVYLKECRDMVFYLEFHPTFISSFGATVEDCIHLLESFGFIQTFQESRADQIHCIFRKR